MKIKIGRRAPAAFFGIFLFTFLIILAVFNSYPILPIPRRCGLNSTLAAYNERLHNLQRCAPGQASPPYILVTFRDDPPLVLPRNVYKFNRDGCLVTHDAIETVGGSIGELGSMRGIAIEPGGVEGRLLLVSRAVNASRVLMYGGCNSTDAPEKPRRFLGDFTKFGPNNTGLNLPYGIAFGVDGNVFVSEEDYDIVLRYYGLSSPDNMRGTPMPSLAKNAEHPGTFFVMSDKRARYGARALASARQLLWVANEPEYTVWGVDVNGKAMDALTGKNVLKKATPNAFAPVGLAYDTSGSLLYVTNGNTTQANAISYRLSGSNSHRFFQQYDARQVFFPTGVVVVDGLLYVVSQNDYMIHIFSVYSTSYKGNITLPLPACPEQMTLSMC